MSIASDYKCKRCGVNFSTMAEGCKICLAAKDKFVVDAEMEASPMTLFQQNVRNLRNLLSDIKAERDERKRLNQPTLELVALSQKVSQEITKAAAEARHMEKAVSTKVASMSAKQREEVILDFLRELPFSSSSSIVNNFYRGLSDDRRGALIGGLMAKNTKKTAELNDPVTTEEN